jgi:hypothetical protein
VVLGAEVQQQEARRARDGVHPLLEEDLAAGIQPVEVLDERRDTPRPARVGALHEAAQYAEELALLRIGIHTRHGTLRVRDAEEFEEQRQDLAEPLVQEQQATRDLLARRAIVVLLGDAVVTAEHL